MSQQIEVRSAYVRRWYAVYCKSREDALAETHLIHQQFRVFRPLTRQRKRRRGRVIVVIESLFPRYLFVELDRADDNWDESPPLNSGQLTSSQWPARLSY